jgi:protein-disulfide isomerase
MKKPILVAVVVLISAFLIGFFYVHRNKSASAPVSTSSTTAASAAIIPAPSTAIRASVPDTFKDTSLLKPPAGAKVAIFEFEDLECPACATAYPIVHAAAAQYKIPLVRHDYPWSFHVWSFDAAITARYLQDSVSPAVAENFRRDVFASQTDISSKEDLGRFTTKWFQSHALTLPFVMDPNGTCKQEVLADLALGDRVGVRRTPCILVVTANSFTQVLNPNQLAHTIDMALEETASQGAQTN